MKEKPKPAGAARESPQEPRKRVVVLLSASLVLKLKTLALTKQTTLQNIVSEMIVNALK